jgi:hypothetical protein
LGLTRVMWLAPVIATSKEDVSTSLDIYHVNIVLHPRI